MQIFPSLSLPDLGPILDRLRPLFRVVGDRLSPYVSRLNQTARRSPKIAAGLNAIGATWTQLVDSFCESIEPTLARFFPDLRIAATMTQTGDIEFRRFNGDATGPVAFSTLSDAERAAIESTKWTAVELRLRPDQVLHRTLSLPGASRDFLAPIIEHRLERLTPWRPEKVLYGYRLLGETEGSITVALTATSKDIVADPMRRLGELGLIPTAIGPAGDTIDEPLRINLQKGSVAAPRLDSRLTVSRIALATFGCLLVLEFGSAFWASRAKSDQDETSARLVKGRRMLRAASLSNVGEREKGLIEAKAPEKSVMVLIDALSRAVPRDTFLKELGVTPDKVRLVGLSGNAPALVGKLEAAGLVNVRFTSAVTRERDQRDSFEITADRAALPAGDAP